MSEDASVLDADRPVDWAVVGGGSPTAEQLAAIAIALTPVPVVVEDRDEGSPEDGVSNWRRAAIIEGIGGRPPASYQDLVQGRTGLGHVGDPVSQR